MPFFTDEPATDPIFVNVRAAGNDHTRQAREHCEKLWEQYRRHADPEFLVEARKDFHARYWEMYLTTALIAQGHVVCCPKPGPDVGIEVDGRRIWFEATSP